MLPATDSSGAFNVLVTLKIPESLQEDVLRLAEDNLPIFARQPGFISAQVYHSHDQTRVLTLLQWESRAAHEACMLSPEWAQCNPQFSVLLDRGTMQMDVRTYETATLMTAEV